MDDYAQSAVAVAAGYVPAANASDGRGSIRIPAAWCGLFGLKPTRARTPEGPEHSLGWAGLECIHALTRSVRDSAALLDATHGADVGAPFVTAPPARPYLEEVQRPPGRLRTALRTTPFPFIAGNPAMSVPLYWNDAGLPIGIQFIGHYGDETTLFRLAGQLEQACPWFSRRPPWSSHADGNTG